MLVSLTFLTHGPIDAALTLIGVQYGALSWEGNWFVRQVLSISPAAFVAVKLLVIGGVAAGLYWLLWRIDREERPWRRRFMFSLALLLPLSGVGIVLVNTVALTMGL